MGMDAHEHEKAMEELTAKVVEKGLGDMVVTPREVDEWVGRVAQIIANGLNIALQPRLSEEEISVLSPIDGGTLIYKGKKHVIKKDVILTIKA